MAENFKNGDVVRLKSGSPKMTIIGKDYKGDNIVNWLNDKKEIQAGHFPDDALELDDDDE